MTERPKNTPEEREAKRNAQQQESRRIIEHWVFGRRPEVILGVTPEATEKEITKAQRALLVSVHPDVAPEDLQADATSITQEIIIAAETLKKLQQSFESGPVNPPQQEQKKPTFHEWFGAAFEGSTPSPEKKKIKDTLKANGNKIDPVLRDWLSFIDETMQKAQVTDKIRQMQYRFAVGKCIERIQVEVAAERAKEKRQSKQ